MLVCLFIVVWLLRAFKLLRFPSFSCKNADFYTKNGRVNFGGFSGLPEQNYEVFFCLLSHVRSDPPAGHNGNREQSGKK